MPPRPSAASALPAGRPLLKTTAVHAKSARRLVRATTAVLANGNNRRASSRTVRPNNTHTRLSSSIAVFAGARPRPWFEQPLMCLPHGTTRRAPIPAQTRTNNIRTRTVPRRQSLHRWRRTKNLVRATTDVRAEQNRSTRIRPAYATPNNIRTRTVPRRPSLRSLAQNQEHCSSNHRCACHAKSHTVGRPGTDAS